MVSRLSLDASHFLEVLCFSIATRVADLYVWGETIKACSWYSQEAPTFPTCSGGTDRLDMGYTLGDSGRRSSGRDPVEQERCMYPNVLG
jgi:hypothetical protein